MKYHSVECEDDFHLIAVSHSFDLPMLETTMAKLCLQTNQQTYPRKPAKHVFFEDIEEVPLVRYEDFYYAKNDNFVCRYAHLKRMHSSVKQMAFSD